MSNTDRIEKQVQMKASKSRVWRALTDPAEFGTWFRVRLQNGFVVGQETTGNIAFPGYEHLRFTALVEKMEPEHFFAFRWHPYPNDLSIDYSKEPMTLVEFRLEEVPGGTRLTVVESGFDHIPAWRRDEAFRMNSNGWAGQMENIRVHVDG